MQLDINTWEHKLHELMIGLDIQNVSDFMGKANASDYLLLGIAYSDAVKSKIKTEREELLIELGNLALNDTLYKGKYNEFTNEKAITIIQQLMELEDAKRT